MMFVQLIAVVASWTVACIAMGTSTGVAINSARLTLLKGALRGIALARLWRRSLTST